MRTSTLVFFAWFSHAQFVDLFPDDGFLSNAKSSRLLVMTAEQIH